MEHQRKEEKIRRREGRRKRGNIKECSRREKTMEAI